MNKDCIAFGCRRPRKGRGLCDTHLRGLARLVEKGAYTWEYLEKTEKCLPRQKSAGQVWAER